MEPLRVLTVDDEEGMRSAISRSLRNFKTSVAGVDNDIHITLLEAASAEEAAVVIDREAPHIVLLDHKLPGKSGIELLEELSAEKDPPLVVMITAYATIETAVQATKRGAYDFLPKPFTPEELRSTLRKSVEHVVVSIQARRLEAERQQVRFQFISVLAHELKAPLNAVQGYIDVLDDQDTNLSPNDRETVFHRCAIRLKYMRKMIDDLLDLTRIESGQKRRALLSTDLVEIVKLAMETSEPDAAERGITISVVSPPSVKFFADADEMEIIFNNLISNAVKYNRDNGSVKVHIEELVSSVNIQVDDTGIGMSDDECSRLFEDFVRIKNEQTRSIPGSGLGLSIVKKIALLYNGEAAVSSTPGVGSTFTVVLSKMPAE
ncbi:MAG: response regulator [Spirochaetales bacterium]|nr:response regulator [Spirochaetales bacterium]